MDEFKKARLRKLGFHRDQLLKSLKNPVQVQCVDDALDAFIRCKASPNVSIDDIKPIEAAATLGNTQICDMAASMLVVLGLDWKPARDVLMRLVSHRNGKSD